MSLRRPTEAYSILLSFQGVASDTRSVHSIPTPVLHIHIFYMNNLHASIMDFVYFVTDVMIIEYFSSWLSIILYLCFLMFASTFKVLTGLSLAIVLARFLAWRGELWWHPRNLRNGDSSLAKIGVILVSCSCGKWSPIDADEPQIGSAISH